MVRKREKPPDATVGSGGAADSVVVASGGGEQHGATVTSRYFNVEQDVVGVAVDALRDFKSASTEEFWQFVIGGFLVSGSFWLGVERLATAPIWWKDTVFWICVVAFLAGLIIGYFGYRQLKRRQTRIDAIINAAIAAGAKGHITDSTGI